MGVTAAIIPFIATIAVGGWWMYYNRAYEPFEELPYAVRQLAEDLSNLNIKNERLQDALERLSEHLDVSVRAELVGGGGGGGSGGAPRSERARVDRRRDFALESAGARIVGTGATVDYAPDESPFAGLLRTLTGALCRGCDGARTMLQPGTMPGECWAFRGNRGEALVRLLGRVNVTGVTLEHISADVSPTGDISSAPRRFQVEGLDTPTAERGFGLGTFEYDLEGRPIQYFAVERPAAHYFQLVRLRFLSNWGHPLYTCVYRVRVHGHLEPGQAYIAADQPPTPPPTEVEL